MLILLFVLTRSETNFQFETNPIVFVNEKTVSVSTIPCRSKTEMLASKDMSDGSS